MKEKELELVTWDNIRLDAAYTESYVERGSSYYTRYDVTVIPAFSDKEMQLNQYNHNGSNIIPKIRKNVKTLNRTFTIDVLSQLGISSTSLFIDLEKEHPDLADILRKRVPADWFEKANAETIAYREKNKAKVQKQYDELLEVFQEHGTKSDLATMDDINGLYYCEAAGFMDKLEKRINKKSNPKNLRIYKALQELRGKDIITCNEG